jgi:hypothetical protein
LSESIVAEAVSDNAELCRGASSAVWRVQTGSGWEHPIITVNATGKSVRVVILLHAITLPLIIRNRFQVKPFYLK